jgi:glycosyltransferase involved in cell wall biosynthesis
MLFSITIPAYKRKYLSEAITSVLRQTYTDFEIIIVNDASPEDLDSIIAEFSDSRIRYYTNERNCGAFNVVDNWNICLSYAKGDYVICMGDDDRLLPCCLEEYAKIIKKYPSLEVYHMCTEIVDDDGKFIIIQQPRPEWESAFSLIYNRWENRHHQFIGDFCYQVAALRKVGGFYKVPLAWGSDDISAVRAALNGGIANVSTPGFQYRSNLHTISSTGANLIKLEALKEEKKWYKELLLRFNQQKESLSRIDSRYLECISSMIEKHYIKRFHECIREDIYTHPLRIAYWIKQRNKYSLSWTILIRFFLRALFRQKRGG